jgi:peptidoglycan/LPS O-acetylase OafA/YrhL
MGCRHLLCHQRISRNAVRHDTQSAGLFRIPCAQDFSGSYHCGSCPSLCYWLIFHELASRSVSQFSKNLCLSPKGVDFLRAGDLAGVFTDNPLKSVNGSLWTLNVELFFYCILPIMALLGLLGRRLSLVLAAVAITYAIAVEGYGLGWSNQGGRLVPGVSLFSALKHGLFFLSGAALWIYKDNIRLSPVVAAVCIFVLILAANTIYQHYVIFATLPYLTIYCALAKPVRLTFYNRLGDLSFGAYIYAFPVQQMVVASLGRDLGPIALTAVAAPITLSLAFLSWIYIEKPALSLRRMIQDRLPSSPTERRTEAAL